MWKIRPCTEGVHTQRENTDGVGLCYVWLFILCAFFHSVLEGEENSNPYQVRQAVFSMKYSKGELDLASHK